MKHIKVFEEFFKSAPQEYFPEYTSLAGMSIKNVLNQILNALPQEEIEFYKDEQNNIYETHVDIEILNRQGVSFGTKRVHLKCVGNRIISTLIIDGYQIGLPYVFLQRKIYNKLKTLKKDLFN